MRGLELPGRAVLWRGRQGVDPRFRSPAKGNYHVRGGSPARNGGVKAAWMDGATDLEGRKRVLDGCPDVGCYEDTTRGLMMIVQ